jgi:hypothetical protein
MAKKTSNSSVNSSIRQNTAKTEEGMSQLLAAQQASLGELTSIKQLLTLSREVSKAESSGPVVAKIDYSKIQEEMLKVAKEQFKGSRRYWKTQEEFQKEWDKEAKDIAEMAKGMKVFKTLGEKMADKKEGLKEKFGIANGGLKKTVLGAMNVGGIFNKTLARDEFVKKQQALGSKSSVKELKADFAQAQTATKAIQKNESKIDALKKLTGADEDELKVHHPKLFEERQSQTEKLSTYDRGARLFSPDKKNAEMAGLLPNQQPPTNTDKAKAAEVKTTPVMSKPVPMSNMASAAMPMSNIVPTPTAPELGKTPTATAAEATQGAEEASENMKMTQQELDLLQTIADNTGGDKKAGEKKPEEVKTGGGGFLDSIFSMLGTGLMTAFKALLNPMSILKALGKVFAIGMIIGALFEGVMDGFNEYMKTGDIGAALIAGLAGIIDFLTFGLFDKEKIKEVIGDFSKWTYDHLVKPFVDFIGNIKDSFMGFIEKIGIPEIVLADNSITGKIKIGPYYPFKSEAKKPEAATPTAPAPQTANQVEAKSAENAGAKETPQSSSSTNVVNAPVTTNNNSTQVQIRPPIRNQDSTQNRYAAAAYNFMFK